MFRSSDRFARQVNARSTCRPFAFLDRRPDVSAGLADSLSYLQPWSIGTIDSGESVICPDNGNRQWKLHPFFSEKSTNERVQQSERIAVATKRRADWSV